MKTNLVMALLSVLLFSSLAMAHETETYTGSMHLIEPVETIRTHDSQPLELGAVGPGQTIVLKFLPNSGSPAPISPTTGQNAQWDQAAVVHESLPQGWSYRDSLLYENPLTVFITVSPNATEQDYTFSINFSDLYEGLEPQAATFKVRPTLDVIDVELRNPSVSTGVGQPAVYVFDVKSKSSAPDTFVITARGLPYDWTFAKTFLLPHNAEERVYYEVVGNIQKDIPFEFEITSLSSSSIKRTVSARVLTTSSLYQDAKATSLGMPLFPSIEQHVYALVGFITNFFLS